MSITKTSAAPHAVKFITSFRERNKAVAATAPLLGGAKKFSHGPFQFHARLTPGSSYKFESSSDMQTWKTLKSGTSGGQIVEFLDSEASKSNARFYRAFSGEAISRNIIGYATVIAPPGFSMIANPFNAPSNTIEDLFPEMSEGVTCCKFDTSLFRLTNNAFKNGHWLNPSEKLMPGEGAIFFNPTTESKTLNFTGDVSLGLLQNPIPAGLSIRSSLAPQSGRLNSDLGFPLVEGDVVHVFDREQQKYTVFRYTAEGWESNPPIIGVGESFWIGKTQPDNWVRDFLMN